MPGEDAGSDSGRTDGGGPDAGEDSGPPVDGGLCPADPGGGAAPPVAPGYGMVGMARRGCATGTTMECEMFNAFTLEADRQYLVVQVTTTADRRATRFFDRCSLSLAAGLHSLDCTGTEGTISIRAAGTERGSVVLDGFWAIYARDVGGLVADCGSGDCEADGCGAARCDLFEGFDLAPDRVHFVRRTMGTSVDWYTDCTGSWGDACDVLSCRSSTGAEVVLRAAPAPFDHQESAGTGAVLDGEWTLFAESVTPLLEADGGAAGCAAASTSCDLWNAVDGLDLHLFTRYAVLRSDDAALDWRGSCGVEHVATERATCRGRDDGSFELDTFEEETSPDGFEADLRLYGWDLPPIDLCMAGGGPNDLRGHVTGPIAAEGEPGEETLHYTITAEATCRGAVNVAAKPFLLVEEVAPRHDGIVLPTVRFMGDLVPGEVSRMELDAPLPRLDLHSYVAGVVMDSGAQLVESDEINNTSYLWPAGMIEAIGTPPGTGFDLYSEIEGNITPQDGGASHTLRTIRRTTMDIPSDSLWALFMAADPVARRVYILPYDSTEVEKQYFALFWGPETDSRGNPIGVDYYWQAPLYGHVAEGSYRFLTMVDNRDIHVEADESNNLDVHPMVLSPLEVVGYPDTWFVRPAAGPDPGMKSFTFRNGDDWTDLSWTSTVSGDSSWLMVEPASGTVPVGGLQTVQLRPNVSGVAAGTYRAEIRFTAAGYEAFPLVVRAYLFVHGSMAPTVMVEPAALDFTAPIDVHPEVQTFTIRNGGTGELEYLVQQDQYFMTILPTSGAVVPGGMATVTVIVHPEGLARGVHTGYITVFQNATPTHPRVTVRHTVM